MESAADPQPLFIAKGERIRFTSAGVTRFAARFARCGIDIRTVKTRAQALAALEASFPHEWQALVAEIAAHKPKNPRERIERDCLAAIALGEEDRAEGLRARLTRLDFQPPRLAP